MRLHIASFSRQEVEQQQAQAVRQSHRAEELEGVLAGVKVKVQGLEDSIISKAAQQQGHYQLLQQDKKDAEVLIYTHPHTHVCLYLH